LMFWAIAPALPYLLHPCSRRPCCCKAGMAWASLAWRSNCPGLDVPALHQLGVKRRRARPQHGLAVATR
jgi:hypothetical protein